MEKKEKKNNKNGLNILLGKESATGKGECVPGPKRGVRPASPAQCWALGAGPPGAPLKPWGGALQPLQAAAPSKQTVSKALSQVAA